MRHLVSLALVAAAATAAVGSAARPQQVVRIAGAELVSEVTVKPVTGELVLLPPRREGETPYLCAASIRSVEPGSPRPPAQERRLFGGSARVLLFAGETEQVSFDLQGATAELTCAVDRSGEQARTFLVVRSGDRVVLTSFAASWLPPGKE